VTKFIFALFAFFVVLSLLSCKGSAPPLETPRLPESPRTPDPIGFPYEIAEEEAEEPGDTEFADSDAEDYTEHEGLQSEELQSEDFQFEDLQFMDFEFDDLLDEKSDLEEPVEEPSEEPSEEPPEESIEEELPQEELPLPMEEEDEIQVQTQEPALLEQESSEEVEPELPGQIPEAQSPIIEPPSQVPEQEPSPPVPREPPLPPPFLRPAEPELPPPVREPLPENSLPELPGPVLPEAAGEQLVFSRTIRVTIGQVLEIPFRGTGWVYLGELGNRRGISYDSRRLDIEAGITVGQSFIFRPEIPGTYILKFYKQDFIQDYVINDHVQVIVGERNDTTGIASADRVVAEPRWPPVMSPAGGPVAETPSPAQTSSSAAVLPASPEIAPEPQNDPSTPAVGAASPQVLPEMLPNEYVRRAKQEFDAGQVESALGILDTMKQRYPLGIDEAWWLYGQLLEANSPSRDIKLALDYYRRLVDEFPQSDRVTDAQRRIAYLERYYFNIR
jgi:hypothetical protein